MKIIFQNVSGEKHKTTDFRIYDAAGRGRLGTVNKLNEQVAKNVFPGAKKKTQAQLELATAKLFDVAIKKTGKQVVPFNYLQVLSANQEWFMDEPAQMEINLNHSQKKEVLTNGQYDSQ